MLAIFKKEFYSYFYNMSGYIFLALFIFIASVFFSLLNIFQGFPDFQYVISDMTILFLIIIPILTMNLYAQEMKNKTDQLIFTVPVSITKITLGKYFAAVTLFSFAIVITFLLPITLSFFSSLPLAQICGTYLGYFLLGLCFISIGIFISALCENQIAAAISTFAAIFICFMIDNLATIFPTGKNSSALFIFILISIFCGIIYTRIKNFIPAAIIFIIMTILLIAAYFFNLPIFDSAVYKISNFVSLLARFNNFSAGILNLSDIVYYLSFVSLFLFMTINTIEKRKW